jgi:hypothetical protein
MSASLCYGGWLCLWAEISTGSFMVHSNVIEKIKLLAAKMVFKKGKVGNILTCAHGNSFSLLLRRGRWWQWLAMVSVGQDINWPVMVHSNVIEKI